MPIKEKTLKKCHSDKRLTIDVIHNNKINEFKKKQQEYDEYIKRLSELNINDLCDERVLYYQNKIKEYEYNQKNDEDDYYLDNGILLDQYYNEIYHLKDKKKNTNETIMNWFKDNSGESDKSIQDKSKEDIITEYMSKIDDKFLNVNINDNLDNINICPKCNSNLMTFKLTESEIYCKQCGYTENILIHSDKTSFKDVPKEISYFAYKRINHFNEWIAQIQAKETTSIDPEIYKRVLKEIQKNTQINKNDITHKQVREILKKIKCNKYYEHIPQIINVITENNNPIIFGEYEDRLRNMFKEIQVPFMKNCPDERKNFLSYSYVLHKFCELLELDDLLEYFPLLKSREKLKQQDQIWQKICHDLKWQYIPSI